MFEQTTGLDMARRSLKTGETVVQVAVDTDVTEFPALETGLMVSGWSQTIKTGFTLEVTSRKSGVEGGWDLASPYVVPSCLHAQWSHISGLVRGGDKDLS